MLEESHLYPLVFARLLSDLQMLGDETKPSVCRKLLNDILVGVLHAGVEHTTLRDWRRFIR